MIFKRTTYFYTMLCLILSIVFVTSCSAKATIADNPTICGNSNGNIINAGMSCLSDSWIYYSLPYYEHFEVCDLNKIYKISTDGKQFKKVNDDPSAMINIQGDWVYYRNLSLGEYGSIYKIKKNGTGRKKLTNRFQKVEQIPTGDMEFWIIGNRIYYLELNVDNYGHFGARTSSKICSVDTEGKNFKLISDAQIYYVNIYENWIYYLSANCDSATPELFKMKFDGTDKTLLYRGNIKRFIIDENNIYFIKEANTDSDKNQLWKMDTSGKNTVRIADNIDCFNISGNLIYVGVNKKGLYKIDKMSRKSSLVLNINADFDNICITDKWVHMTIWCDEETTGKTADYLRLKTDGTNLTQIDNVFNKNAYVNKKLYTSIYNKFNFVHTKGALYYPKAWQLYADFPNYTSANDIINDQRSFSDYGNSITGLFGFYDPKNPIDKFQVDKAKQIAKNLSTIKIRTKNGKSGTLYYNKTSFVGLINSGKKIFSIRVNIKRNNSEVWKNIIIDMLEKLEI